MPSDHEPAPHSPCSRSTLAGPALLLVVLGGVPDATAAGILGAPRLQRRPSLSGLSRPWRNHLHSACSNSLPPLHSRSHGELHDPIPPPPCPWSRTRTLRDPRASASGKPPMARLAQRSHPFMP